MTSTPMDRAILTTARYWSAFITDKRTEAPDLGAPFMNALMAPMHDALARSWKATAEQVAAHRPPSMRPSRATPVTSRLRFGRIVL